MTIVYAWLSGAGLMLAVQQRGRRQAFDFLASAVCLAAAVWGTA